jgi:hypothetical protein
MDVLKGLYLWTATTVWAGLNEVFHGCVPLTIQDQII